MFVHSLLGSKLTGSIIIFCGGILLGVNSGECISLRCFLEFHSPLQQEKRIDVKDGGEEAKGGDLLKFSFGIAYSGNGDNSLYFIDSVECIIIGLEFLFPDSPD